MLVWIDRLKSCSTVLDKLPTRCSWMSSIVIFLKWNLAYLFKCSLLGLLSSFYEMVFFFFGWNCLLFLFCLAFVQIDLETDPFFFSFWFCYEYWLDFFHICFIWTFLHNFSSLYSFRFCWISFNLSNCLSTWLNLG